MVRLTERRRAILAEKFGDLANYAVAALVFGQAVGQDSFSFGVGGRGYGGLGDIHGRRIPIGRREPMSTALFMLGGIALIAFSIARWDWFARRKDRQSEHHRSA